MSIMPSRAKAAFERFVESPGPIVVGAVQGASCFGPAYEFVFILDTELRKRRIRDRVPMTFVTAEPYIGHLGLDGVGDTKGLLESELRQRHIKWITNARVKAVEPGKMTVEEASVIDGNVRKVHELPFAYSMMLPAFRGIAAVRGIEGLTNPRGFILVDKNSAIRRFRTCSASASASRSRRSATPVPTGVPKTGFMIESMVTATALNIGALLRGASRKPRRLGTRSALPTSATAASPSWRSREIPPRNVNWSSKGRWVHYAKIAFENTSCARSGSAKASRSMNGSSWNNSGCARSSLNGRGQP